MNLLQGQPKVIAPFTLQNNPIVEDDIFTTMAGKTQGQINAVVGNSNYQTVAAVNNGNTTLGNSYNGLFLTSNSTIAAYTIKMKANPVDGELNFFRSQAAINALTVQANSGQTIISAPSSLEAAQTFVVQYMAASNTWYMYVAPFISTYGNIYVDSTDAVSLVNGEYVDLISGGVTLPIGEYVLSLQTYFSVTITGSGTNNYMIQNGINTTAGNSGTGLQIMINSDKDSQNPPAAYQKSLTVANYPVVVTTPTTFYAKAYVLGASASGNVYGNFSYVTLG